MTKSQDACDRCLAHEYRKKVAALEHALFIKCLHCKWGGAQEPVEDNEGKMP